MSLKQFFTLIFCTLKDLLLLEELDWLVLDQQVMVLRTLAGLRPKAKNLLSMVLEDYLPLGWLESN